MKAVRDLNWNWFIKIGPLVWSIELFSDRGTSFPKPSYEFKGSQNGYFYEKLDACYLQNFFCFMFM